MKKSRIYSCILAVWILLSMLTVNVLGVDTKVILSDVPFDYMTNMETKLYSDYQNLSIPEQKLVYCIPEDIAESLTTESLLKTILNNEFLMDLFAYDNFVKAVQSREEQFRIIEFLKREDSIDVLDKYIELYGNDYEETDSVVSLIKYTFLKRVNDNSANILGIIDSDKKESKAAYTYVYTKGGQRVNAIADRDWVNASGTSELLESIQKNYYAAKYNATIQADISPVYNCHSYAWHNSNYSSNNVWIEGEEEIQKYLSESVSGTQNPQIGITKVLYYYEYDSNLGSPNEVSHSAKVYSLNSNGDVVEVISKWGNNALFVHSVENSPYYFSNRPIAYRNY